MHTIVSVLSATLVLLAGHLAHADTLVYADGRRSLGTLEKVTFRVDAVQSVYKGKAVASVRVSRDTHDVVVLHNKTKRVGTLVSVRFNTPEGVVVVRRAELAAIEHSLAPAALPSVPPARKKAKDESPDKARLAATKKALAKNVALRNACWDKAADVAKEAVKDLKADHIDDYRECARDIADLEDTIKKKERRRREDERRSRITVRGSSGYRRYRRRLPPPNDGLEDDKKALREQQKAKTELLRLMRREKNTIADAERTRKRRIEAVYASHKKAIDAGQLLTPDEMVANYKAALGAPEAPTKDDVKEPDAKDEEGDKDKKSKKQRPAKGK